MRALRDVMAYCLRRTKQRATVTSRICDDAREDWVFWFLTGLAQMPGSRRMGEFQCRFWESDLTRLSKLHAWLGLFCERDESQLQVDSTGCGDGRGRCTVGVVNDEERAATLCGGSASEGA